MRILLFFVFFLIINCSNNKMVYWCGDHPCINKKEKEEYFKKTMTVEVRNLGNENFEDNSKNEKLINNVKKEQKTRIKKEKDIAKQLKLDQKKRIKEEKKLAKKIKLEEKRRIKEEKNLAKQLKLREKKDKKEKKLKKNNNEESNVIPKVVKNFGEFSEIVEKITTRNSLRPYPEINDIPN